MSDPTYQELKDLILSREQAFQELLLRRDQDLKGLILDLSEKFDHLDKKVDQLDTAMQVNFVELKGEIKRLEEKIDSKIEGLDKRVVNAEFVNRSVLAAGLVAALTGLVKLLFFSNWV